MGALKKPRKTPGLSVELHAVEGHGIVPVRGDQFLAKPIRAPKSLREQRDERAKDKPDPRHN